MMRRLPIALEVIPRHPAELVDRLRCTGLQCAGNRRLLGTAGPPKGALHCRIEAHGAIALGDGLGPTEDPQQTIEDLLDGAIAHGLLGDLHLFPQGSKETLPPQILAQGTQARTAGRHRRMLVHGALLSVRGYFLFLTL